jgi:hypothetical protein
LFGVFVRFKAALHPIGQKQSIVSLLWIGMATFFTMALSVPFFGSKAKRKKQLI